MNPSITPGPWRVSTRNDYQGIAVETAERNPSHRTYICHMEWDDSEPYGSDVHDSTKANACAIAAVPDLVAACKAAVQAFEALPEREIEPTSAAYVLCQAALAKAGF